MIETRVLWGRLAMVIGGLAIPALGLGWLLGVLFGTPWATPIAILLGILLGLIGPASVQRWWAVDVTAEPQPTTEQRPTDRESGWQW